MSQPLRCCIPPVNNDDGTSDETSQLYLPPFSPTPSDHSTAATSNAFSVRSASPTPSVWSITSSIQRQIFKHEFGRELNNYSNVYRLPADAEELDRLDKQHKLLVDIMGRYPPPLQEIERDDSRTEPKSCLDLGCGSGSWIIEFAQDFPQWSTVAVDLIPMQSSSLPPNCRSEVDDLNFGLEHYYGDFDYVHVRLVSSGIRDYSTFIDHISRVLRPGGLAEFIEFDFRVYDRAFKPIVVDVNNNTGPWWPMWLTLARNAMAHSGGSVDAATRLHEWISSHPGYVDVVYREFWVPTSPWAYRNEKERQITLTMRDDILAFLRAGRPLILGHGVAEELLNEMTEKAAEEVQHSYLQHYIRIQTVYARKSSASAQ